jgi:GT2 family glycosyltransferase
MMFRPIPIFEVEIGAPFPSLEIPEGGEPSKVLLLVRLHGCPIGVIEIRNDNGAFSREYVAESIAAQLAEEIADHLSRDDIQTDFSLTPEGLPVNSAPKCQRHRTLLLKNAPAISVIIATRNRPDRIRMVIESILLQTHAPSEIIIVDNAPSTEATRQLIEEQYGDFEQIKYVREDRPGLASAHNAGLERASGSLIAITDDDVRVDDRWLEMLASAFLETENVGCVTGIILPAEIEAPAQLWTEQYSRFNKGYRKRIFDLDLHRIDNPLYPYAAGVFGSGANMAFKREALTAIGGFDTALGAGTIAKGADDLSAFFDIINSGYRLVYEPAAVVWHWHRRDLDGLRKQAYGYGVGLTAYLTRIALTNPRHILQMAPHIPQGLNHVLNAASPKNSAKNADYPKELNRIERMGMLVGPIAYLRSKWQNHKWSTLDMYE